MTAIRDHHTAHRISTVEGVVPRTTTSGNADHLGLKARDSGDRSTGKQSPDDGGSLVAAGFACCCLNYEPNSETEDFWYLIGRRQQVRPLGIVHSKLVNVCHLVLPRRL